LQALIQDGSRLISSSKDGSIKVWDVTLQHCCQTLLGFNGEVWSLDVNPDETRLVAGCVDTDLRVYAILNPDSNTQQLENQTALVAATAAAASGDGSDSDDNGGPSSKAVLPAASAGLDGSLQQQQQHKLRRHDVLIPMGTVRRAAQERVSLIRFDAAGQLLGVLGAGKTLEIFRYY
jgi:U3 small nucleolar RNA-associated protein 12